MRKSLLLAFTALFAAQALTGCMPYKTGSTEVGVRTIKWSLVGNKGVDTTVYEPGSTHFFVPFLTDWHTFDTKLQILEMTSKIGQGDRMGRDELLFKTIDGNDISLDVTISYRIIKEKAPILLQRVGTDDLEIRENLVRTVTRSMPRDIFGELNTEQFYIADERKQKTEQVKSALNEVLGEYGIYIDRVDTGDYMFNDEYMAAIEAKKVADQDAMRLMAETKAKQQEYLTDLKNTRADVTLIKREADGEFDRAKAEAEAYAKQQELIANAIIAEGQAEAEAIRVMNEALAGAGGEAMVKLKIAEALQGKRIVMLPLGGGGGGLDVRTTDINQLLQLYGIQKLTGAK